MNKKIQKQGNHLLGDLYDCADLTSEKFSAESIHSLVSNLIIKYGLHELGDFFYTFTSKGVSGIICLAESHISIHTWPEICYVTLDVFVCNYSCDNSQKAERLFEELITYFHPTKIKRHEINR